MLLIGHDIVSGHFAVLFPGLVLAEVGAADQLTHHQEVDALLHDFGAQGAGVLQLGDHLGGAQVGVQLHAGTQGQQALLGTDGGIDGIPLGAADGRQQSAVAGQAGGKAALRQGHAEGVDGVAAHGSFLINKGMTELGGNRIQNRDGLSHDFGADAVTPDDCNSLFHGRSPHFWMEAIRPPLEIMSLMNSGKGSA